MRVLVGIDLRASGHEWLVQRAGSYAERLEAQVDLVYLLGAAKEEARHRTALQALLDALPKAVRGSPRVEAMDPADGLVELSVDYELMVVGSREPPALERMLRGPMATRVLRGARCPVLVPRSEGEPGTPPRLLVGIDVEGPDPGRVLAMAGWWAEHLKGAIDPLYVESSRLPHIADRSVREAAEREWAALRAPKVKRLQALLDDHVAEGHRGKPVLKSGEPEDVLVQLSADYDVILVGNRDREGLARLLLGAVGNQVVRRADSDVISLPTSVS
ncbi:MAG: universal stress protein [Myxococcales bacterium]|nr:universal stress protein [Myxococcales bacterium]